MTERVPAEAFHVGEYLREEMEARDWDIADLALRMGSREEYDVNYFVVELLLEQLPEPDLLLGAEAAKGLAKAFGTSPEYWLNLDKAWRDHAKRAARALG